jgi:hypothetical protein
VEAKVARNFAEAMQRLDLRTYKFTPFDTLDELNAAREESGLELSDSSIPEDIPLKLAISLECLAIFHLFLAGCAAMVFVRLAQDEDKSPKLQATLSLLSGMATDVAAIELRARSGFDIQAKGIVRSLHSGIVALVRKRLLNACDFESGCVRHDVPPSACRPRTWRDSG